MERRAGLRPHDRRAPLPRDLGVLDAAGAWPEERPPVVTPSVPGRPEATVDELLVLLDKSRVAIRTAAGRIEGTSLDAAGCDIRSSATSGAAIGCSSWGCTTSCTSSSSTGSPPSARRWVSAPRRSCWSRRRARACRSGATPRWPQTGSGSLAADLSRRLGRLGAAVAPLPHATPKATSPFHWGQWFVAAARSAIGAAGGRVDAIGYAGGGTLALLSDDALDDLISPVPGEVVANNRFSADAFVVAGDLDRALAALDGCDADNAAPRQLAEARLRVARPRGGTLGAFRRRHHAGPRPPPARPPGCRGRGPGRGRPPLPRDGAVARRLGAGGAAAGGAWRGHSRPVSRARRRRSHAGRDLAELETETACRVRALVEERGMRSARTAGRPPRSILAALMARSSPTGLVAELARLGDAVVLDTRVLMASVAGSSDATAWPRRRTGSRPTTATTPG